LTVFPWKRIFWPIAGAGQVGLDKTLSARTLLLLDRDLTASLVSAVPQTQLLTNANGQLEIPVQIEGRLPHVMVLPDKEYITQRVIASKAQELVTSIAQNPEEGMKQIKNMLKNPMQAVSNTTQAVNPLAAGTPPQTDPAVNSQELTTQNIFGSEGSLQDILGKALNKEENQ
jgi:hypothetical protein